MTEHIARVQGHDTPSGLTRFEFVCNCGIRVSSTNLLIALAWVGDHSAANHKRRYAPRS